MSRVTISYGRAQARAARYPQAKVHVHLGLTAELLSNTAAMSRTAALCGALPIDESGLWQWTDDPPDCGLCLNRLAARTRRTSRTTGKTTSNGRYPPEYVPVGQRPVAHLTLTQARDQVRKLRREVAELRARLDGSEP